MSKAVAPGQHGAGSQSYVYTKLNELTDVQPSTRVNIWAVVKFFKEPQRSRGTDYFQMFSIVDDSLDPKDQTAKLVCVLFSSDLKTFPKIRRVGDVIRLHRVNVKPYNQQGATQGPVGSPHPISALQAVSSFGFSWVIVDGDPNSEVKPCSSSQEFTFSESDRARAIELRNWFARSHLPEPQSPQKKTTGNFVSTPQPPSTQIDSQVTWIDNVGLNNYFNVPVMVVGSGVKASDSCLLYVTDGSALDKTTRTAPPFAAIDPSELTDLKIDKDLVDIFADYMVHIVVFDDHCQTAQTLRPGDFVFVKNAHCITAKTSSTAAAVLDPNRTCIELVLHGKTHFGRGLRKMSKDEPMARLLNERIENLKIVAAEAAEERAMVNLAARSSQLADQSIGPFADDMLQRQSRYHESPSNSPNGSPAKMAKMSTTPMKATNYFVENDDEWEIVKMRDVAVQTNLP